MTMRIETFDNATLYLGDCRDVLSGVPSVGAVVTDPPYPNGAGHFDAGIDAAIECFTSFSAPHWLVFWTEVQFPPIKQPIVAVHIWHRSNTNRPDNYEPCFEFHADGKKRASRCMSHYVIFPGLTGIEASGHPTEKNPHLMRDLIHRTKGLVFDPFMGSGTTGVACARLGRRFIGIEIEPRYFDIACRRIEEAQRQGDMLNQLPPAEDPSEARMRDLWAEPE